MILRISFKGNSFSSRVPPSWSYAIGALYFRDWYRSSGTRPRVWTNKIIPRNRYGISATLAIEEAVGLEVGRGKEGNWAARDRGTLEAYRRFLVEDFELLSFIIVSATDRSGRGVEGR